MSNLIGKLLLNRYRVDSFLGSGGMAEVYKVWDNQRMTFLAMKVLHEWLAENSVLLDHFREEANTLSKLQHPNIVRFYGFEQDRSRSFILMDFIEGETLKTKIARHQKAFSLKQIKEFLRPLLGALQFAHNQNMVHCDIKPANIMISKSGTVLLTDFGIARATYLDSRPLTSSGTPAYMAPEQVRNQPPSPPTDIYALGIVLFEMLTGGQRPFTGSQAKITGSTGQKTRWEQVNSPPPALYRWNPDINPALNAVIMKCLAKDTARRYQSSLALLNALKMVKSEESRKKPYSETTYSKPDTHPRKKRKKPSKAPLIILLGVLLFSMIVVFMKLFSDLPPSPIPAPRVSFTASQTPYIVTKTSTPTNSAVPIIPILIRPYDKYRDADAKTFDIVDWVPLMEPGHAYWKVDIPVNTKSLLMVGWCAKDKTILRENLLSISNKVIVDGYEISLDNFAMDEYSNTDGSSCKRYQAVLSGWQLGDHSYIWHQHFSNTVNDGWDTYLAGDYIMESSINVK